MPLKGHGQKYVSLLNVVEAFKLLDGPKFTVETAWSRKKN